MGLNTPDTRRNDKYLLEWTKKYKIYYGELKLNTEENDDNDDDGNDGDDDDDNEGIALIFEAVITT